MWRRILSVLTAVWCSVVLPAAALAAEAEEMDPRLEGYGTRNVSIKGTSISLTWILLIFLTLICIAVLFKNARRTHLD